MATIEVMLTFQEVVNRLTQFWMEKGCIVHLGHDVETGAGTFNPATFLRCLGPEPYRTVYVEPSRRPQDGRYGKNPNRLHLFHQLQVIMKPSPPDIQQLYLQSLEALGLDLSAHDIRFVHDDWEAPTQGAWGLGWEVWIDGMEATQFTYFQSVGGLTLKPISVELAYGLERLCMYLQDVDSIFDVKWNDSLTMGDINKNMEEQWSTYNFEYANTDMWKRHFEDFEKEAKCLIDQGLSTPAYDFVIKASHAFNMLDSRGVISPTERTGYIARVRDLSCEIAESYLTMRQRLKFPLIKNDIQPTDSMLECEPCMEKNPDKRGNYLLEIGSEQLPAHYVLKGCASLEAAIKKLLNDYGLKYERITTYGSPQRIAVYIQDLARGTHEQIIERKGPATNSAFGSDGNPTLQGSGFLKAVQVTDVTLKEIRDGKVQTLEIREIKGQEYLFAKISQPGRATADILSNHLPKIIGDLHFQKKMRWGSESIEYPRPIHWICSLFDKKVVNFQFGPIVASNSLRGHAQRDPDMFVLKDASDYLDTLKKHYVIADHRERRKLIEKQLEALEREVNGTPLRKTQLLDEVSQLVEWPELAVGCFDEAFLRAPAEVLISEMAQHQRYFPLIDATGNLINRFIITADNTPSALVIKGNQKVLSARLSDGLFLYDQDRKCSLETMNERLKSIVFQKSLGSMADKVNRLERHAVLIANTLNADLANKAKKAAHLCKADLASLLVGEFPELQGTIGKDYALQQNEDPDVASAIEEHWMPRADGAQLPSSAIGEIVALSDKIDNLLGYFSVGLRPTSSSDPYACRRTAIGLLKILINGRHCIDLASLLTQAATHFEKIPENTVSEVLDYLTIRAKGIFEEKGYKKDEIEASLKGLCIDPYDQFRRTDALHKFRSSDHFHHLFEVYKRAKGQLSEAGAHVIDPELFNTAQETNLFAHLQTIAVEYNDGLHTRNYAAVFDLLATLRPFLADLFNNVKILDDEAAIRKNRLALLQKVFGLFEPLIDFGKLQVE